MTKRLEEARANVGLQFEYANMNNHLICACCKAKQNFEEWKNKTRKCPKPTCNGALFRPAKLWTEVQKSFLDRWVAGIKLGEERLAKIDKETMPPFRLLTRHVFDKETKEMVEEPIITPPWEQCAEHFFERQQEAIDRVEARKSAAENEAKKASEKVVISQIKAKPCAYYLLGRDRSSCVRLPLTPHPLSTYTPINYQTNSRSLSLISTHVNWPHSSRRI